MLDRMEKIITYLKKIAQEKFTGKIEITFNQGGIIGVSEIKRKNIEL